MGDSLVFDKDLRFESERLSFRGVSQSDSDRLFGWRSSPHVFSHARTPQPPERTEHDIWFAGYLANSQSLRLIINEKVSDKDIGLLALDARQDGVELSYYLGEESAQGKGYMKEALSGLLDYLKANTNLQSLLAESRLDNHASVALIEGLGGKLQSKHHCDDHDWARYAIRIKGEGDKS